MGEVLCVAAVVLLIVMFVGHGMWLIAAWLFRAVADEPRAAAPRASRLRDELQTTIQHLKRLGNSGAISRQQCDELVALFEAELTRPLFPGQASLPAQAGSGRRECLPHAAGGPAVVGANGGLEVID